MKGKANFAGDPIHPMLVHYPIALWTTSVVSDVIFYFHRNSTLVVVSKILLAAGILGAFAAAIPGTIDWLTIKKPIAKKIGTFHLILNLCALVLFGLSLYLRMKNYGAALVGFHLHIPFVISVVALVVMGLSASLGGKLVYEHRVGVNEADSGRDGAIG